jgi:hypothetical protein
MTELQAAGILDAVAVLDQNQVIICLANLDAVSLTAQITEAALSLARHIEQKRDEKKVDKPSLLDDDDEENKNSNLDIPLWLVLTAKERIASSNTLFVQTKIP